MVCKNTVVLKTVINQRQRAVEREVRRKLFKSCREAVEHLDDSIYGFAIVVWNEHGALHSAYDATLGL
jgi:hypothetical protein